MEIITDRTYEDVQRVIEFEKRGWANLSEDERTEWLAGMKGALNHTDLNRMIDNSLDIYAKYLEVSGAYPLGLDFFIPQEQYVIVILTKGNNGTIYNRYGQDRYYVGYGINVLQLQEREAYYSSLESDDGYVFEMDNYNYAQTLYSLVQRDIIPKQNDLETPLLVGNELAAKIRRPNCPSDDYRGILSSGVSIDFTSVDFEKINECEKTLLLSYDWVFNGMIEFPFDWTVNNNIVSNDCGLNPSNNNVHIHIYVPVGYIIEVVYGYPHDGHVSSIVGKDIYYTGEEIEIEVPNFSYMYDFNIIGKNNIEDVTIATNVTSNTIDCRYYKSVKFERVSGVQANIIVIYAHSNNSDENITCNFGETIDVSEYDNFEFFIPGGGSDIEVEYTLESDAEKEISELDTDDIRIWTTRQ